MRSIPWLGLLIMLSACFFAVECNGQEQTQQDETDKASEPIAAFGPNGVQRFASKGWSSLLVGAANPSDEDKSITVAFFVDGQQNVQYAKEFWLPANSQRELSVPIRLPENTDPQGNRAEISMMQLNRWGSGRETFSNNAVGMPISKRSVMQTEREMATGYFLDPNKLQNGNTNALRRRQLSYVIEACRSWSKSTEMVQPAISFHAASIPDTYKALDQLDQAIIAGDGLQYDSHGIAALRQWVRAGGKLWIMADLTSPELVNDLLGSEASFSIVDRVELNDYEMSYSEIESSSIGANKAVWDSERPATFARVLTDAEQVDATIDGWPAAFWQELGEGRIMVTTLSINGWIDKQGQTTAALRFLSSHFFEFPQPTTDSQQELTALVNEQIGYRIPSRTLPTLILALNGIVILAFGLVWTRQRKLERMAFLIPASAGTTALVLLLLGGQSAKSVPTMASSAQVIQVHPSSSEADIESAHALYCQQATPINADFLSDALLMPSSLSGSSQTERLLVAENGQATWVARPQAPGAVKQYQSETTVSLTDPINVHGTFDEQGFRGTMQGLDVASCSDALISSVPAPATSVDFVGDGDNLAIAAPTSNRMATDQLSSDTFVTDTQRSRFDVTRSLIDRRREHEPVLLTWSSELLRPAKFDQEFEVKGNALYAIPIQLLPPESGSKFKIPATFIRLQRHLSKQGRTTLYNPRTGKWTEDKTGAARAEMELKFPHETKGMQLQSLSIRLKAVVPDRGIAINMKVNDEITEVYRAEDLTGSTEAIVDLPEALQLTSDGTLWFEVVVTESNKMLEHQKSLQDDPSEDPPTEQPPLVTDSLEEPFVDNSTWTIESMDFDATAIMP